MHLWLDCIAFQVIYFWSVPEEVNNLHAHYKFCLKLYFFFSEVIKIVLWVLFVQCTFAFSAKTDTLIQKKKKKKLNLTGYLPRRKHLHYWHSWSLRKLVLVKPLPSATACSSGKINMGWTNFPGIRRKEKKNEALEIKKSLYQLMITEWLCLVHAIIWRYFPVCFLKPPTYTLRSFIHKEALVTQSLTAVWWPARLITSTSLSNH